MKKLFFTVALSFIVGLSFGQKKAVGAAKNEAKSDKPNIEEARTLIKGAMSDPETKDNAETWYVAGLVENKQFDTERAKEILGQKPNEDVMYKSLIAINPYFLKADELDQKPDEKGKVKPKFRKDMKSIIQANRAYYINGGAYFFEKKDYKQAYEFFKQYLDIPNLDMFQGDKIVLPGDTTYIQIKYYAAVTASQMGDPKKAAEMYESLKNDNYKENEVYQYLCYEYEQLKDTIGLVKTLKEGVEKFPNEPYYLLSLINQYIYSNQNDEAIGYLEEAIGRKPNDAQLHDVLGRIYENKKDIPKAVESFEKALSIDPAYAESLGNLGRIYFNEGVEAQAAANDINDNKQYQVAIQKAKDLFKKAMPYFEKAHELKPEERDYIIALRGIYYNLEMGDKFDAMDALLNSLNK